MRILYIHGLESVEPLSLEKRTVLEAYGTVVAPQFDYFNEPNHFNKLLLQYIPEDFDVLIGSSMGGYMAYYLSLIWNKPCLVFNPALPGRPVVQHMPEQIPTERKSLIQIVLGAQDNVVDPAYNLVYLSKHIKENDVLRIHIRNGMEHRVSVAVLKEEMALFTTILNQ